jgi:hypothetical protein
MKAHVDPSEPSFGPGSCHHVCQCFLCQRERRFHRIAAKLKNPRDQSWMLGFYDYVVTDLERELAKTCSVKRKPGQP